MPQLVVIVVALLCSIPSPNDVRQAAKRVTDDSRFQTELIGTKYKDWVPPPVDTEVDPPPVRDDWDWQERTPDRTTDDPARTEPRRTRRTTPSDDSGGGSGPALGNALLWLLLGVVVCVGGFWIARSLSGHTRDAKVAPKPKLRAPVAPAELSRPKTEAEKLADAGRFAEAIHVLLLETLRELGRHLPGGIRKSYTSREIIRQIQIPEQAAPALEGLVASVERSLFGHEVPSEADYLACVGHFQRFAAAYGKAGTTA